MYTEDFIQQHGIKGQKWGVRRMKKHSPRIKIYKNEYDTGMSEYRSIGGRRYIDINGKTYNSPVSGFKINKIVEKAGPKGKNMVANILSNQYKATTRKEQKQIRKDEKRTLNKMYKVAKPKLTKFGDKRSSKRMVDIVNNNMQMQLRSKEFDEAMQTIQHLQQSNAMMYNAMQDKSLKRRF